MSGIHERLLGWQLDTRATAGGGIASTVHRYCRFLAGNGVAISRATLALSTLHPQIQALRYVWYDDHRDPGPFPSPALFLRAVHHPDGCTVDEAMMSHGAGGTESFRRSPFHLLAQGAPMVSYPLSAGGHHEFPVLDDLATQGASHYLALQLPGCGGMISLVTRQSGGFDDDAMGTIRCSLSPLCLLLDSALKDLILDTVLNCYVGASPADEIKRGNIRPGAMMDLHGAIWFSDIRNYSTHAQNTEGRVFIEKLNAYYDLIVPIIYAHHGEVLKFIGDAVLAIFPDAANAGERRACANAFAAARAANDAIARDGAGFDHGIGLHVGHFQFGNVGSLRRMDFTVIGNEVNVAARVEAQCSTLNRKLLMSEAFVLQGGIAAKLLTRAALKGIAGEFSLYVPAD